MRLRLDIETFVASGVPLDAYERCSKSCLHVLCVLEPLRHGCSGQSTSVAVRPTAPQPAAESAALVSVATSSFSSCSTWHTVDIQRDVLCNIQHDTSPQDRSTAVPSRMQYHVCTARSDGDGGGGGGGEGGREEAGLAALLGGCR